MTLESVTLTLLGAMRKPFLESYFIVQYVHVYMKMRDMKYFVKNKKGT